MRAERLSAFTCISSAHESVLRFSARERRSVTSSKYSTPDAPNLKSSISASCVRASRSRTSLRSDEGTSSAIICFAEESTAKFAHCASTLLSSSFSKNRVFIQCKVAAFAAINKYD